MTFYKKRLAGFTIIELIISVAIIGFIVSLVMPRFIAARLKAERVAVQASLHMYRTEAQSYWNTNKSFGLNTTAVTTCPVAGSPSNTFLDSLAEKMAAFSVKTKSIPSCSVAANGTEYAVFSSISLESDPNIKTFCVDSTGYFGFRSVPDISDYKCL